MQTAQLRKRWFKAICIGLALGTFILYLPVIQNGFVNLDDGVYIYQNRHVATGLSWQNIRWSFSHIYLGYWIPLTWISHMIDCSLFGLNPAGHHLMNVFIHAVNAVLLLVLLNYTTGALWRSAFVAAAFAWHPLRVESVAWACERKDVLSGLFWMLALLCYARYARGTAEADGRWQTEDGGSEPAVTTPSAILHPRSSAPFYLLALLFFACGLMSKPMVVTLPFVLFLLDYWPLQRRTQWTFQRLLLEKLPFFILSFAACVTTYRDCGASASSATEPISFRLIHSSWGYLQYISKTFAPLQLAAVYPFPAHDPIVLGLVGVVLVLGFTFVFVAVSRSRPYLPVGWFWFLGTLVPVIGIVQSGYQSMADRFTYLPCVGLYVVIAWGMADLLRSPRSKPVLVLAGVALLAACLILTSIQIRYWRDSITLFRHALAVTTDNFVACACLGEALDAAGDEKEAIVYCKEAVRLNSEYPDAQFFLGEALWKTGDLPGALTHLNTAARLEPDNAGYEYNLGKFLLEQGKTDDAISHFTAALNAQSDFAEAHNALGKAFLKQGRSQAAADELSQAVTLEPDSAQFHYDLGTVFLNDSQTAQAITEFSEAIRLQPDFALAHENLAVAEAGQGKMADAIKDFARTVQLEPNDPDARFNLGFAYLNNQQPAPAAEQFSAELHLTPNETKAHYRLAQAFREENELSQAVKEYRQTLRLAPTFADAKKELDDILATHPALRVSPK